MGIRQQIVEFLTLYGVDKDDNAIYFEYEELIEMLEGLIGSVKND